MSDDPTALAPPPSRHPLLPATRRLGPLALLVGALCAALLPGAALRLGFLGATLLFAVLEALARARRPVLVCDAAGYRVEVAGRVRFAVPWSAVREVRLDRAEGAAYVDCGDKARNLLLPPERGYAFSYGDQAALLAAVLAAVPPERVREVQKLE